MTITSGTIPGSPIADILDAFNRKEPLAIAQTGRHILANGITIAGTAPFLGQSQVQITATFRKDLDFSITAQLPQTPIYALLAPATGLKLPSDFGLDLPATWLSMDHSSGMRPPHHAT